MQYFCVYLTDCKTAEIEETFMIISDIIRRALMVEDFKRDATKNFNFLKNSAEILTTEGEEILEYLKSYDPRQSNDIKSIMTFPVDYKQTLDTIYNYLYTRLDSFFTSCRKPEKHIIAGKICSYTGADIIENFTEALKTSQILEIEKKREFMDFVNYLWIRKISGDKRKGSLDYDDSLATYPDIDYMSQAMLINAIAKAIVDVVDDLPIIYKNKKFIIGWSPELKLATHLPKNLLREKPSYAITAVINCLLGEFTLEDDTYAIKKVIPN